MRDGDLKELLAAARAIHFAYQHGAITYLQAKHRSKPLLLQINKSITIISKRCGMKPKYISFSDLGLRM